MPAMTKFETRRRALQHVVNTRFGRVGARFGSAIGRQSDYVSRLLNGKKNLGDRLAEEIEKTLGLEPGELSREPDLTASVKVLPVRGRAAGNLVPILGWEQLVDTDHRKLMAAAEQFTPRPGGVPDHAYALTVRGPAMEPEFRDGWLVIVDSESPVKHGDFVIALAEGRRVPLLRQLVIEGDATYLRAINPTYPEPMIPLGKGRIYGRVSHQTKTY